MAFSDGVFSSAVGFFLAGDCQPFSAGMSGAKISRAEAEGCAWPFLASNDAVKDAIVMVRSFLVSAT
ncbi:hypothetical protein [Kordiimonas lipolytica]|uniref:hypothetical protein n=1 Tax=Kordiimonas lipolytica TaxID=1662421 RepID=UPI00082C95E2|nr:hypothetical protein [Kordiimonas lipolytica]